ncbi:ABC transporter permease [Neobacillus sp. 179-C4.2 HS]|uniref:ABC transporter permease n=1 Tax=Neobacillus driksii TaxID=3035913 RepID=A0ABV4YR28_9BACI|nr:ABC transporter permease [Neobacillus sp. 179.-C4.2 HS]MDP5193618.1 ABC transporter permease [Neobacillus sp. 179.-C4.2 HS]
MSQWMTLFQKEVLEMWRNFKWIWVPLTFILLGVSEPLTSYYLPQIMKSVGGLPEGAIFEIPKPTAGAVLASGLSQYSTIGALVIVLGTMGIIAGERKSGVAAMILVKPVSYFSFITSKWAGSLLLVWISLFIGYISTWYYTGQLFDWVPIGEFFQSFVLYGLWLTVILTVTVFFSAALLSPGMAGFISLALALIISILSGALSNLLEWSPSQLTSYAGVLLTGGELPSDTMPAILIALLLIVILLWLSVFLFKKKELAA